MLGWRSVYLGLVALRFVFGLADSYIHPDEHFQLMEVLTHRLLGYNWTEAWEFTSKARSLMPLYAAYGPLVWLNHYMGLLPLQLWYLIRLGQLVVLWMMIDWCIHRMLPTKPERVKATLFVATLYITLAHQSHLFLNCLELVLLMVAVFMIDDIRGSMHTHKWRMNAALAVVVAVGLFTRITFPAFLIIPGWFVLQYWWNYPPIGFAAIIVFGLTCLGLVAGDSYLYGEPWTVAPLNNLKYNVLVDNLAQHGLHPYWTHIAVNLPQLLGPGIIFLFWGKAYKRTVPFLTVVLGLVFLSVVPHQEARFLIPLVPVACCCFNLDLGWVTPWLIKLWYLFNLALAVLMGVFHQGGVVPAVDYLRQQRQVEEPITQLWWRTYSPPTWMLADTSNQYQFVKSSVAASSSQLAVVDCMGMDPEEFTDYVNKYPKPVYVVMPQASFATVESSLEGTVNKTWSFWYHYDLDHLDFSDTNTLHPGLSIFHII